MVSLFWQSDPPGRLDRPEHTKRPDLTDKRTRLERPGVDFQLDQRVGPIRRSSEERRELEDSSTGTKPPGSPNQLIWLIMKSVFRLAARRTGLSEGAPQSRAAPVSEKRIGLTRRHLSRGDLLAMQTRALGIDPWRDGRNVGQWRPAELWNTR